MKVVFLEAVQNFGGARKSTLELAERLMLKGDEVLIIDFWGSCIPFIDYMNDRNIPYIILDKRKKPFLLHNSNKIRMLKNYFDYGKLWFGYRKKLKKILGDEGVTHVVVNNAKTLSILSKSKKQKIIYFARGWFLPKTINRFNKFLINRLVDKFVGVSQATRHAIFAGNLADIRDVYVVPNAIDINKLIQQNPLRGSFTSWEKETTVRPFTILHCGGFLASKGQGLMLKIAQSLKEKNINFKILLVGIIYKGAASEKYYNKIVQLIKQYELQNHVKLVVNQSNVLDYFVHSDVLVHPTHTEGLPRVAMEAMAFGKPVIGNPSGGMTDYILDEFTGYLTNFDKLEDYIEILEKLYSNKDLYGKISNNAFELIKSSYNLDKQYYSFKKVLK